MAYNSIIVRNLDELEQYHTRLKDTKKDLERLMERLRADCRDQERNWEDDQYRKFEEQLTAFADGLNDLMKDKLNDAMAIVEDVLERLK